jgi:hypothetical protein
MAEELLVAQETLEADSRDILNSGAENMLVLPIIAAGKAATEAAVAGWYFYQMSAKEKK